MIWPEFLWKTFEKANQHYQRSMTKKEKKNSVDLVAKTFIYCVAVGYSY